MSISLQQERDRTMDSVSRITCWCITIALHQEFGIGKTRQERVAASVNKLQQDNYNLMIYSGRAVADRQRENWIKGICQETFRVPMLRGARTNREKQIRMAGNEAATVSWQLYAKACIDVLGYGTERLNRLHKATWENYQQFNEWAKTDLDWAMDRMKRCAEAALQEEMQVVEDDPKEAERTNKELKEELKKVRELKIRHEMTKRPGFALLSNKKIEQIAASAMEASGMKRRTEDFIK